MTAERAVLIVDDHPLFREGVKALIRRAPGFTVVAEAGGAAQARKAAQEHRPDVILLDLGLPDGKGTDLIRQFTAELPHSLVVVLSMHSSIDMVAESFRAGAAGYIVKESAGESLIQALSAVSRGEQYLDSAISPTVIRKLVEYSDRKTRMTKSSYDVLTRREQQILRLLAEGASARAIAENLFISRKTVENHRSNILAKLGLATPLDLVRYAMRKGLVALDDEPDAPDQIQDPRGGNRRA